MFLLADEEESDASNENGLWFETLVLGVMSLVALVEPNWNPNVGGF